MNAAHHQLSRPTWPALTCLCPTYGRFQRLRDAVACFLLQDYPGEAHLLILNDAPGPLCEEGLPASVAVVNAPVRYPTLGHKRQALLQMARTLLVAHWDDDDLYLPWHLTSLVTAWREQNAAQPCLRRSRGGQAPSAVKRVSCVKPRAAWYVTGTSSHLICRGLRHNVFEGQMLFERERAMALGGYPPRVSGQAKALLDAFRRAGELHTWEPGPRQTSYAYRWADGAGHVSAGGDTREGHRGFAARNRDFGAGRPLVRSPTPRAWARRRLEEAFGRVSAAAAGGPRGVEVSRTATYNPPEHPCGEGATSC